MLATQLTSVLSTIFIMFCWLVSGGGGGGGLAGGAVVVFPT